MRRFGALALAAAFLVTSAAFAGEFDWKKHSGKTISVMLVQHPYAEGIIQKVAQFEQETGIKVNHATIPEENYFDKLTTSISSRQGEPDVFMTGAYQTWEYAPPGYMVDLDKFLKDPSKTSSNYNYDDFFPGIVGALRWDLVPGHKTGSGSLWALPLGFECYQLTYNKEILSKNGVGTIPADWDEFMKITAKLNRFDGEGTYGVAVRGSRNWATIHPGYISVYSLYGAQDLAIEDGRLVSKVNSPEAVAMTDAWVKMIREGGSPTWANYTWYQCGADLGAGKAAIMFDASNNGFFQNVPGATSQAGKLAAAPIPLPKGQTEVKSNLWVWALGMNSASKEQDAAWYFIQWFTARPFQFYSVIGWKSVDPPRKSVFESPEFQAKVKEMDGYAETFNKTIAGTTILFTPNPYFFELTTEWAATLQDIVAGKYATTQEGMDQLKEKMDAALEDVELE
ncbi:MAG: sugar ABC transporter substrate-binding protein [Planctomycetota bacterium]|jgi:multiple sugar transport system substrate-binding protein|nr:sugar ABC transporter substrate-binding protein [Planctomycetota bacterium]